MNNELLIIDGEKAYRCVAYRHPKPKETWLGFGNVIFNHGSPVKENRCILEEVPSLYILREGVDDLVSAADAILKDKREIPGANPDETPLYELTEFRIASLTAALEPFTTEPKERWRWDGDSIFDGDTEFNIANVEGCTELVAALNELNAGEVND